ncbi:hypothetical protein NMC41_22145 [Pseudomonas aeruginosa]
MRCWATRHGKPCSLIQGVFSNHDPLYRAYGKQDALAKQLDYFRAWPQLEHDWIAFIAGFKAFVNWMNAAGMPFGDRITEDKDGKKKHDLNLGGRGKNSFETSAAVHKKWLQQRKKHKGFADTAHPFVHQGSGKPYLQKMFLELSHALLRKQGRMGMIVPSGIYTDKGTTDLRELFLGQCDWQWLFGFENREGIFDIHRSFKFCPLIVQKGGETKAIRAAFMHRNVDDWEQAERHVLAYPRARVEEFSPYSKAILEIRSEQDLRVLQKIYANGVLLGDQSEKGWGIKYQQGDFNMTSDSKLFPPRPKWEEKGYQADEYGHWLKGAWRDYHGPQHILEREPGLVLSRDGQQALQVDGIEDVALPLYEGRMIGQFDFSEKGWVSGKGRGAVWSQTDSKKHIAPQYLMSFRDAYENDFVPMRRLAFMDICSATNARTFYGAVTPCFPCGHSVPLLSSRGNPLILAAALNSFVVDQVFRLKVGGLHLTWNYLEESPTVKFSDANRLDALKNLTMRLNDINVIFAENWSEQESRSWRSLWALTPHERLRIRCAIDAIVASIFDLSPGELAHCLFECDLPRSEYSGERAKSLNPKGFWRIDKDKDPELRHTVLSLVAFHDLQQKGLDAFLAQNNGEGWLIPEQLRLADYGLGHDNRAQEYQPVASRLGPRFFDWQLNEDVERSWQECAAHAELIRRIVPLPQPEHADCVAEAQATYKTESPQGALF